MHVNIIIPTVDRLQLLRKTIKSIQESTYKDVSIFIVIDGNHKMIEPLLAEPVGLFMNPKRKDWVYSMNMALRMTISDAAIYASDDLKFAPDCIENAVKRMRFKFPDGDGLVAIKQNVLGCTTAFGLVGRKFIERFPQRQVFCPDYVHYGSDFELGQFARSIGKLNECKEAKVVHERPKDTTFKLAKPNERQDIAFKNARADRGLLWGRDFVLLRK